MTLQLGSVRGVSVSNRGPTPAGDPVEFPVSALVYNGREVGRCNKQPGAALVLKTHAPDALIHQMLQMLDKRDGINLGWQRQICWRPDDPRKTQRIYVAR